MTPPVRPAPVPDGDHDPAHPRDRGASAEGLTGPGGTSLVWPPPEDELDSMQVISLGPPAASAPAPAHEAAPPRLEIAVARPTRPPASAAPPSPLTVRVTAAADPPLVTDGSLDPSLRLDDGGRRVPLWVTILLMLASGAGGFAAAWYLR